MKRERRNRQGRSWVSSGSYGYLVGQSIVYVYLPMEGSKVGTQLEIKFLGEEVGAMVVQSPLCDPKGEDRGVSTELAVVARPPPMAISGTSDDPRQWQRQRRLKKRRFSGCTPYLVILYNSPMQKTEMVEN